jgi:hypothetical protein
MATGMPRRTATLTRTPAAAGNRRVQTLLGHTVGATREAARDQQHSVAPGEAVGNHARRARAAGAVAVAAEAGAVAASEAEVSVAEDEDRFRPAKREY